MIPKVIHYCWFGRNEKSKKMLNCIESWKKFCPEYTIVEWNEDNFDIRMNPYTRYAYENKKYAFLSDYVRLFVLYREGGIYFDTDVELVKPIDDLLEHSAYFGFETDDYVNTGLGFGAEAGNPAVKQMLLEYNQLLDGKHDVIGCPELNTQALLKMGLKLNGEYQNLGDAVIYPAEYFNPYEDATGYLTITKHTYSIHWYCKSPHKKTLILRSKLTRPLHRIQKMLRGR